MDKFPLVEVAGEAFEMGLQHGQQAKDIIRRYLAWIGRLTGKTSEQLHTNALRLLPYIEEFSPQYVKEIQGLAAGANISFADAVLCQVRGEAARDLEGGCTAFAFSGEATADGLPLAGQNQDLESDYSDVGIILKVRPTDGRPRAVMFTFAGQLGYAGINQHGVSNFVNALYNYRWQRGLPYYPIRRALLEQRTVPECIELLRKARPCSAANFVLADGTGDIADVECRPEGIAVFDDSAAAARIHTNHYLAPTFRRFEDGFLPDSPSRLSRMRNLVQDSWGKITVDTLKIMLADHADKSAGICRHGADHMHSIAGYIAEPAKALLHVRRGHGCDGAWTVYAL